MNRNGGKNGTRVLTWVAIGCALVGGLAATATWKPDLYRRWLKGRDDEAASAAADRVKFATAKVADLRVSVTEEGKLRAIKSHPIFPQLRGSSRITFLAPEGATVKKGDLLVAFDKKAFEDQLLTTSTELAAAQRAYAVAQLAVDIQERAGASAVKLAETKLREAEVTL